MHSVLYRRVNFKIIFGLILRLPCRWEIITHEGLGVRQRKRHTQTIGAMVKTKLLAKRKNGLKKLALRLNGLQCLKLILLPSVHKFFRLHISGFASGYIMMPESGICSIKSDRTCQY